MAQLDVTGVLERARAHGLRTDGVTLAGIHDASGVLHSSRSCRLKARGAYGYGPTGSVEVELCSRCAHKVRVLEDGQGSRFTLRTLLEFITAGVTHLEAPEVPDEDVIMTIKDSIASQWGQREPYAQDFTACSAKGLLAWEESVKKVLRDRRLSLLTRAGTTLLPEVLRDAARSVLAVEEASLGRFKRAGDALDALVRDVAEDPREYLVAVEDLGWRKPWWGLEVLATTHRVSAPKAGGWVLKVPVVVLARLEKDQVAAEAAALGRASAAELEAFSALYDPRASSEVKTLKGALRVARAL